MNSFKKIAIVSLVLVSGLILASCKKETNIGTTTGGDTQTNQTQQTTNNVSAAEINYTSAGFLPSSLSVGEGLTITVKNSTSSALSFNSDPHPQHTNSPELNLGKIEAGQSKTFTIAKAGTYTYHDHLNPSMKGTIVVQ